MFLSIHTEKTCIQYWVMKPGLRRLFHRVITALQLITWGKVWRTGNVRRSTVFSGLYCGEWNILGCKNHTAYVPETISVAALEENVSNVAMLHFEKPKWSAFRIKPGPSQWPRRKTFQYIWGIRSFLRWYILLRSTPWSMGKVSNGSSWKSNSARMHLL